MNGRTRETSKNKLLQQQEIRTSSSAFLISHLSDCDSLSHCALLFKSSMSGIFLLNISSFLRSLMGEQPLTSSYFRLCRSRSSVTLWHSPSSVIYVNTRVNGFTQVQECLQRCHEVLSFSCFSSPTVCSPNSLNKNRDQDPYKLSLLWLFAISPVTQTHSFTAGPHSSTLSLWLLAQTGHTPCHLVTKPHDPLPVSTFRPSLSLLVSII